MTLVQNYKIKPQEIDEDNFFKDLIEKAKMGPINIEDLKIKLERIQNNKEVNLNKSDIMKLFMLSSSKSNHNNFCFLCSTTIDKSNNSFYELYHCKRFTEKVFDGSERFYHKKYKRITLCEKCVRNNLKVN